LTQECRAAICSSIVLELRRQAGVEVNYCAHSSSVAGEQPQSLQEHLEAVARLAEASGEKFGATEAAALAGRGHDIGKYALPCQSLS
jgi:HD-GYP domain-containing protein (c-di-GMP phosphodiesterase class II)